MFNFETNFGVFIGTSSTTLFRLGVSKLDGTDVLANAVVPAVSYVDFSEYCTEVQVSNGVTATGSQIDLGTKTGTIVLTGDGIDPLTGYFIKVSSPVKLVLKSYPAAADTDWFYGFIKNIERETDAYGITRVVLTIGDQIEQLMNIESTISVIPDQIFEDRWASIDAAVGTAINVNVSRTTGGFTFTGIDIFEVALGDTILQTMQGELGWLITTRFDVIAPMSHTYLATTLAGAAMYEIHQDVTDSHIPPTYINVFSSSDSIVSTINTSLSWDLGTQVSVTDQDQAELYGNSTLDVSLDLANATQLLNWATYALTLTGKQNIKSVSVDAFDHRNMKLHKVYEMEPAQCALVNVQANGVNVNENYLISKVSHIITPTTWQTDIELWRN
jgi:hypothetical protein